MTNRFHTLGLLLLVALTSTATAQTGPDLVLSPWDEGKQVEGSSQYRIYEQGKMFNDAFDYRLRTVDSQARWKVTGEDNHDLTIGFDHSFISLTGPSTTIGGAVPGVPNQLHDMSFAVGATLGNFDDWKTQVVLGLGYTGHRPFADEDGWYAKADLMFTKQLDEKSQLMFILDYNGNRNFLPDVPLPGVAYSRVSSETLRYSVGIPYSTIWWKPADRWTVDVQFVLPTTLNLEVAYDVNETVQLFGSLNRRVDGFRRDDNDIDNRRIFYERTLAEGGIRWQPCADFALEVAGGYAFNQEFTFGYDTRDTNRITELSDEPYVSFKVDLSF